MTNKKHSEHIVCIKSSHVKGRANGFVDYDLQAGHIMLGRRAELEKDDDFRQLLPIAVFLHNKKIWVYRRATSGGESRLFLKLACATGGHWDFADLVVDPSAPSVIDIEASIRIALERELREEINLTSTIVSHRILKKALCADDTEVDRLHMAIVNIYELDGEGITANEEALEALGFIDPQELLDNPDYELEAWTKYICQLLVD
jgi:predicted NUDIX family phosphoesterase